MQGINRNIAVIRFREQKKKFLRVNSSRTYLISYQLIVTSITLLYLFPFINILKFKIYFFILFRKSNVIYSIYFVY